MYRRYSDKRIYRDVDIAVTLTIIGLIMSIIFWMIGFALPGSSDYLGSQRLYRFFDRLYNRVINTEELTQLNMEIGFYYIFLIAIPIWVLISARNGQRGVRKGVKIDQGRTIVYDTSGWTVAIIVSLIPIFVMVIDVIRYIVDKSYHFSNWPYLCGRFLSHIVLYILQNGF